MHPLQTHWRTFLHEITRETTLMRNPFCERYLETIDRLFMHYEFTKEIRVTIQTYCPILLVIIYNL